LIAISNCGEKYEFATHTLMRYDGKHEAIVSDGLWRQVQVLLSNSRLDRRLDIRRYEAQARLS